MKHQEINGYGRPVLMKSGHWLCETVKGSQKMIVIPRRIDDEVDAYFDGVEVDDTTCYYLPSIAKSASGSCGQCDYREFVDADNDELRQHLKSTKVSQFFRNLANDLMCSIPLQ